VSFKYDPFGRRIYKSSSSATSVYAYDDDGNLIEETSSSGAAVARYSQTQNIDEPLAILRSGATSYYHADGLGSITSSSNGAGALAQTYTFDSFGKQIASSGSLTNPFQYTARELDSETNLYYYRARYYDLNTGRFLSEDPVEFNGGGNNFYRYVNDNPLTLVDPFGLAPGCRHCIISVKCRGVQYKHLGAFGFKHCDARVVGSDGIQRSLTAGPTGDPLNSDLNAWDVPNPTDPFTGRTVCKKDPADCAKADCLINKTDSIHDQPNKPKYHAIFGPNSDTMLKDIFASCGINLRIRWYGPPILYLWPLP
jgi:RHS repeat-associated protein